MGKNISSFSEHTDRELILQWQAGNEQAFAALYLKYVAGLVKEAAAKTNSLETGQELVQELFLDIFLKKETLNPETTLYGYLHTALKNKILNYYRLQLVRQKYRDYLLNTGAEPVTPDLSEHYELREKYEQVQQTILGLPPQCRTVFLMSREEQLSYKEIATLLGISVNTVEQQMSKALKILRRKTDGFFSGK